LLQRRQSATTQEAADNAVKKLRYKLEYLSVRFLFATVPWLPRRVIVGLANFFGALGYWLFSFERRVALTNLDIVFRAEKSPLEKRRIARLSFQSYLLTVLDFFWTAKLSHEAIRNLVTLDDESRALIKEISGRGKGAIALTMHYGNWELLLKAAAAYDIPMTGVANRLRNVDLDRFITHQREARGHRIIYKFGALPKLAKVLQRGETAGIVMDQNTRISEGGLWIDFFGVPATTSKAMAGLALNTGAPICYGVCYPTPDGRYRMQVGPEVRWQSTADHDADVELITRDCMAACEAIIRRRPEYWMWSYRRWKWRPSDEQGKFPFYSMVLKR
jgi:Kdo2-lipid IVA lauroyltransferase/acyltransferase